MVSKNTIAVLLLIFAIVVSIFSLVMSFDSEYRSSKNQNENLPGNVNLEILPSETPDAIQQAEVQK